MSTRRGTFLLMAVLAGAGLVGCGGADDGGKSSIASLSANEILAQTKTAVTAAKSVHATGDTVDDDGTKSKIDLRLSEGGSTGSVTVQGVPIEILVVGQDFFIKANKDAWTTLTGEAAAGELLAGRFVKVPSTEQSFKGLKSFADWDSFVKEAFTPEGTPTKGETKQIDGVDAVGLVDSKDGGTLWIPVEDDPLPLQAETSDGSVIKFRDWGEPVTVKSPPADEVIDLGELTR